MTPSLLAVAFVGLIAGYWVVSALIDRLQKRGGAESAQPPRPEQTPTERPAPRAEAIGTAQGTEPAPPSRSVWDELGGGSDQTRR